MNITTLKIILSINKPATYCKTRITTFIKAILMKSDGRINIEKYRVAAHKILKNNIAKI